MLIQTILKIYGYALDIHSASQTHGMGLRYTIICNKTIQPSRQFT
jgi:hypothetical protein